MTDNENKKSIIQWDVYLEHYTRYTETKPKQQSIRYKEVYGEGQQRTVVVTFQHVDPLGWSSHFIVCYGQGAICEKIEGGSFEAFLFMKINPEFQNLNFFLI